MNVKANLLGACMGALGLCALGNAALAGSTTPPGERAGVDLASPLPEGVYFVNVAAGIGNARGIPSAAMENFDVPALVWSTPWQLLGGRFELVAAAPAIEVGVFGHGIKGSYAASMYNPFLAASWNFNLGGGFSASFLQGFYLPISGGEFGNAFNQLTLDEMLSLAYHNNGWNATANLHLNIIGDNVNNGFHTRNGDAFIYDLGLTKTLGKWEVGVVGFGSTDVSHPSGFIPGTLNLYGPAQAQFALGGLVGYNFGPVIMQTYVTTDIYKSNYPTYETRGWLRVIVPLWNPEAPKAVAAKY